MAEIISCRCCHLLGRLGPGRFLCQTLINVRDWIGADACILDRLVCFVDVCLMIGRYEHRLINYAARNETRPTACVSAAKLQDQQRTHWPKTATFTLAGCGKRNVMVWCLSVRLSVPYFFLTLIGRAEHVLNVMDSPGGQHATRPACVSAWR